MEVTALGYIVLPLLAIGLFLPIRFLAGLVIAMAVWHASAVFTLGEKGVSPFFVAEIFFLVKSLPGWRRLTVPLWGVALILLLFYILYSVLFYPEFFAGVAVLVPEKGMVDSVLSGGFPLMRTRSQWAQLIYTFTNAASLLMFYAYRFHIGEARAYRFLAFSMLFVAGVGLWEFLAGQTALFFPYGFVYSNPGYEQMATATAMGLDRLNSLFIEPSFAGGVLAASFWMFAVQGRMLSAVLCFLALVLTLSATGVVALCFGLAMCLQHRKITAVLIVAAVLLLAGVAFTDAGYYIQELIFNKLESDSASIRLRADLFTVQLLENTFGFGAGLGSHRPSSLLGSLLGNVGVPGLVLYMIFLALLIVSTYRTAGEDVGKRNSGVRCFLFVLLAALMAGIPDFNFAPLWAVLFVLAVVSVDISKETVLQWCYGDRPGKLRL